MNFFRWMKQHNPQLKNAYLGASRNELFICYDKKMAGNELPKQIRISLI